MASNKELIDEITKLDKGAVTEDLNNAQLAAMLKKLKHTEAMIPTPEPKGSKPKKDSVVEGKAITTKAGIKGSGVVITAKMLSGGDEALNALRNKGFLVK